MLQHFVLNTGAIPADGVAHLLAPWVAPDRLQLRKLLVWIGTDGALPGQPFPLVDVYTTVFHQCGLILAFVGFDHYVNFSGVHQWRETFEPGQVIVEAGHAIGAGHCAVPINPALASHSHTMVFGWYEALPQ